MATGIPMPSTGIKTFTPKLKIQPLFNVYEAPITITPVSSLLGPTTSKLPKSDIAAAYLNAQHGIPTSQIKITSAYTDAATGITHVYAQQTIDGTDVANGLANVNINSDNQVISSS
ncbi:hypothetical protein GGI19_004222, partial [Coemansia pectinata]